MSVRVFIIAVLAFCIFQVSSTNLLAHGDHDTATAEQSLKQVDDYLNAVLARLEGWKTSEYIAQDRSFHFFDSRGRAHSFSRSELVDAVVGQFKKSIAAFGKSKKAGCGNCTTCGCGSKVKLKGLDELTESADEKVSRVKEFVHEFLESTKRFTLRIPGSVARGLNEYDALTLIAIGLLWPIYTPISEVVESVFVGPFHVFCFVSQVYFFAVVSSVNRVTSSVYRALTERSAALSLTERMKLVKISSFGNYFADKRRKTLKSALPAFAMSQASFSKAFASEFSSLERLIALSPLWADLWQQMSGTPSPASKSSIQDFDFIFSLSHTVDNRIERATEHLWALEFIYSLLVEQSLRQHDLKKVSFWSNMKDQWMLGKYKKQMAAYRVALLAAAISQDAQKLEDLKPQLRDIYFSMIEWMAQFRDASQTQVSKSEGLSILSSQISDYRAGRCRILVAQAGLKG